jgi:CheY-like chemotaxis protein
MAGPQEEMHANLAGLTACILTSFQRLHHVQGTLRCAEQLNGEAHVRQRRWRMFLQAMASPSPPAADPAFEDRTLVAMLGLPEREPPGALVLIVEDDTGQRFALRFGLEEEGYTVLEAADGVAGLELLRTSAQPLVVLLDWKMPGLDGVQVLQRLYADASAATLRHTYLLMTAAVTSRYPHVPGVPDHMDVRVLAKLFDLESLLPLIAERAARISVAAH